MPRAGGFRPRIRRRVLSGVLRLCLCAFALSGCGEAYPPPLSADTSAPTIRVLLGRPRASAKLHLPKGTWEIQSLAGRAYSMRGVRAFETTLRAGAAGIVVNGRDTGATRLRVRPDLTFGLDRKSYQGELIVRREQDRLKLINELDLETYIAGVIGNEVGPNAEPATYRAQAVTARTYAYIRLSRSGSGERPYHLFDDARSQVYSGIATPPAYGIRYTDMVKRTLETRGVILTWEGRPFPTYYASTCGGHTTEAATSRLDPGHAADVLRGVPCKHCGTSKYFKWTRTLSDAALIDGMRRQKRPVAAPIHAVAITKRGRGGWVAEVTIQHGPRRTTAVVPGTVFRSAAGLRSHNLVSVRRVRGGWTVKGLGWGHGVGMCQWGAIEMGRKGATETEILRYYYPGVSFTKIY